jgi:protein subunit release factor A
LSLYSLDKIMTGDMGEVIAALKDYDRQQRLKKL